MKRVQVVEAHQHTNTADRAVARRTHGVILLVMSLPMGEWDLEMTLLDIRMMFLTLTRRDTRAHIEERTNGAKIGDKGAQWATMTLASRLRQPPQAILL
jgi:hypothetical protein